VGRAEYNHLFEVEFVLETAVKNDAYIRKCSKEIILEKQ
jgi:hypothetical protein